jgi:hypothetical protein
MADTTLRTSSSQRVMETSSGVCEGPSGGGGRGAPNKMTRPSNSREGMIREATVTLRHCRVRGGVGVTPQGWQQGGRA